ncbi:MAG: TonB-dependent receptor [Acidobacteriaceae bacterium]|nr:TonB-dependent receptor [Acidobacteriaceae bacterium]
MQRIQVSSLLFLASLGWNICAAQDFRGSLAGVVEDSTGGYISGAATTIQLLGADLKRETKANRNGEFRFNALPPGEYRITVNAKGFAQATSTVAVQVTSVQNITVTLKPAALAQTVNVTAGASSITTEPIDLTTTVQGGVVGSRDLETLPLASRSFANIAYLLPGTEPVEPSDPTKARITAVSFGGSSGLNDVLSVDGGDNSDDYIGGFLQNFSPAAIEEFAVETSQEQASIGRTVGGAVMVTTKRGTNDWHGLGAFYDRAAALNARFPIENPAPLPKQPFSRQNYVGAVGGPIEKDKLWFFSSLEAVHERASIAYSPASLTQFNALAALAAQGLIPGVSSIGVPTNVPVPFRDYLATLRFDWSQSSRSQWFLRASIDNYTTNNAFVQQATLPSTGTTWHSNYMNLVLGQQYSFSPSWVGSFTFDASFLGTTQQRNSTLGFALAFPFSSTSQTISGFETFGDNQFVTPITAFPVLRKQEKYQFRYLVAHSSGSHSPTFGIDFIHEPVLSGALSSNPESLTVFAMNPTDYVNNPAQFSVDLTCTPTPTLPVTPGTTCSSTPAGNGSFDQNVQRLGLYAEDSWRATPSLTINYGLRYDTTFGLFIASGRSQLGNPALLTLQALQIPLFAKDAAPHDYRDAFGPRVGIAYTLGQSKSTVLRASFGLYYNDLAQNGWVTAFQAVNAPPGVCVKPGGPGCLPGAAYGGSGALIDPSYKAPYALHASAGVEHAFNSNWIISASWVHEEGVHAYRRYQYQAGYTLFSPLYASDPATQQQYVPNLTVFRTDNRSRYDGLMFHLQANLTRRFSLIVNDTVSSAETWGCVLGELFDYVNGVCNPLNAFAKGDYGPSGEDVLNRFVLAGIFHAPGGFELSTLMQAETARPFTMTTPVGVNGVGDTLDDRAVINGVQTSLDEFRGTPYIQVDLRVARPINFRDRYSLMPFIEFFNLFNRNNPGANYVTNLAALPIPVNSLYNATAFCLNSSCTQTQPITSLNQLRVPAGALGDFFGPGTTVGIPFAAQIGVRFSF